MKKKQYTECYIAFLDMLGFKKMIEEKNSEEILSIFNKIKKPYQGAYTLGNGTRIDEETIDALKIKVMSDSICFYIDVLKPNALLNILISCLAFQFSLLDLSEPILLRGAIVRGKLYAADDILFGPGLTQAYLMEEYNAKYPRIIITNDVLDHARQDNASDDTLLKGIDTQITFRDFDAFYTLNFVQALEVWDKDKKIYNRLTKRISYVLDSTMDESIREKYLYLEKVLKKHYLVDGDSNA